MNPEYQGRMRDTAMKGYYFITDPEMGIADCCRDAAVTIGAGTAIVQYRRKYGATTTLYEEACQLREVCRSVPFVVNDRLDLALAVDADGIHIGQSDLPLDVVKRLMKPDAIIGVSAGSVAEAVAAEAAGATYLGVGPIFATSTKADAGSPIGLATLREIREACTIPIAAIGGITLDNAAEVVAAGADMLCAIQAVLGATDVAAAASTFHTMCTNFEPKE